MVEIDDSGMRISRFNVFVCCCVFACGYIAGMLHYYSELRLLRIRNEKWQRIGSAWETADELVIEFKRDDEVISYYIPKHNLRVGRLTENR